MQDILKSERVNSLLSAYGCLLTDKQKETMEMYFCFDLSLSEIAENMNTSRSAVSDLISRTQRVLEAYEQKLMLLKKHDEIMKILENENQEIKDKIEELL